jgi:iron(III) transport system ATP-binding protein
VAFVRIKHLTKRFGKLLAVDNVALEVAQGRTLALLGPSGCGKTTILRCIAGLETADSGSIEIAGSVVFDHKAGTDLMPEQRALGIVFQSYAVWPHMSVADNVGFPLKVRRVAKAAIVERVAHILDLVGLGAAKDMPATALSGGQQQRVALARALIHEPRLVLFDEPMSNLDAQLREQVRMELKVLQDRLGFTAIYVTHDQAEAFTLAETIVVMNRGRIETMGPPRDVFYRPQTPFVAQFLGLNVEHGRLVRCTDSYVEVALGGNFTISGRAGGDAPMTIGAPVIACVRKEHVVIRKLSEAMSADAEQTFEGEVRALSFRGLEEEYIVAVDGVSLNAIQPPRGVVTGERVAVVIRPDDCVVFAEAPEAACS